MPKRKSLFDEHSIQSKIHVGVKEVNMGVNSETNMKKVYDRTHDLLFHGSYEHKSSCNGKSNGHLVPNGIHEKNGSTKKQITNGVNGLCTSISCSFCEKSVPLNSSKTCHVCSLNFCHLCSIIQYGSQEEMSICLSCLR